MSCAATVISSNTVSQTRGKSLEQEYQHTLVYVSTARERGYVMAELAEPLLEQQIQYTFVDDISLVTEARQRVRFEATETLEHRRKQYELTGTHEYLQVDALSTAHEVIEAGRQFGASSSEYGERYNGLLLDCQRLVGEWYRKNTSEYFSPIRHVFDADKEEFFSHGLSIRQMTENALTPIHGNPEEEARRINERVEEATPHIMRSLGKIALGTEKLRTISECSDKAIQEYQSDIQTGSAHRGYNGYVPEIEKVMLRDIWLDAESDDRFEEQIGLPGTYITHDIITMTLEKRGLDAQAKSKTALHGSQILANDSLLSFVADLDQTASEQWCTTVFMGEAVPADHPRNYDTFRQEALARQQLLMTHAEATASFVLNLAEENYDRTLAPAKVEAFVKKLLIEEAKYDTKAAHEMFDSNTADGLEAVVMLEQQGRFEEAMQLQNEVEQAAPGGGFCGAGSCGLENVDLSGKTGESLVKQLGVEKGDVVLKDTERACRCGSKDIIYAFNKTKVNKLCTSCGSFESKYKKAA